MPIKAMKQVQASSAPAGSPVALRALAAALGLGLCQCPGGDGRKAVEVTPVLPGRLGATVLSLRVEATLDGKPARDGPQRVGPNQIPFTLVLPPETRGRLGVEVRVAGKGAQDMGEGALKLAAGRGELDIGDATDYKLPIPLDRAPCQPDGWCYDSGPSRSVSLRAIWGAAPDDIWVVGDGGTRLHWDGFAWEAESSGTTADLFGVWGSGAGDVWSVGDRGTIVRLGQAPASEGQDRLRGIWGSGPRDIWAVGDRGTVLHYDGSRWQRNGPDVGATLSGIWGSGPSDAWIVGQRGTLAHWDGSAWSLMGSGVTLALHAVGAAGPGSIWIVGDRGTLLRLQGNMGLPSPSGVTGSLYALWGDGAGTLWAAGQDGAVIRGSGDRFSQASAPGPTLYGLWGTGQGVVWAVGAQGTILRHADGRWTLVHQGPVQGTSARAEGAGAAARAGADR